MNDTNDPDPTPPKSEDAAPAADEAARLRQERDALQDQLKRSLADLANIRRRHAKEMEQVREFALEAFARELLPVLDNFHLALEAHEQHASAETRADAHALVQGLEMVRSLLEGVLERHGVREIEGHGHPFDPTKHEAVGIDAGAEVEPGHVAKVLQRGYFLSDKVLRPSRVIVREQKTGGDKPAPDRAEEGPGSEQ